MKKGITPVIAIIVLLFITIALAGAAWTYMQGFFFGQITKTFNVPPNGIYCQGGKITVIAQNTGYQTTLGVDDFIVKKVTWANGTEIFPLRDTEGAGSENDFKKTLQPGEGDVFIETDCNDKAGATKGCGSGAFLLNLATSSTVQRLSVTCP